MAEAATAVNHDHTTRAEADAPSSDSLAALSLHDRQTTAVNPSHDISENQGIPIANQAPHTTSFSQAATPMNETFLSTLAPGMSQRFDLAEEGSSQGHVSDRVPETLEEESDSLHERSIDGSDDLIFS